MDVPASKTELTNSDLKDALRVCLITAIEESFQREMKAAFISRWKDLDRNVISWLKYFEKSEN
jgi:hypothetical protein